MKRTIRKILSVILIINFLTGIGADAVSTYASSTETTDSRTVKIGFFEFNGFQYYNKSGEPTGYNVEYLDMISNFTGWNYEYVSIDSYAKALELLKNREIDLMAPVMLTADWMENYDYSSFSMGTGYYALVCDSGNKSLNYEDWDAISKTKVALAEGYPITEAFIEYLDANAIEMEIIYYDTTEEAVAAMKKGDTDCTVTSLIAVDDNYKVLSKYCSSLMYYITWKGNSELIEELNVAMEQIQSLYSDEVKRLEKEYFPTYTKQYFSKEELEFIENNSIIRVAYTSNNIPISYTDKSGKYDGITYGILEEVSMRTGLQFEYVEIPDTAIDSDFFSNNSIDLIADVENNEVNKKLSDYYLTVPYYSSEKIFVAGEVVGFDEESNYKVALHSGSKTIEKAIAANYPNLEIVRYATMENCFDALGNDEVDFILGSEYNVEYYMNKPKYADFCIIPTEGIVEELCFATYTYEGGMSANDCRTLIHILDKAIAEILAESIDDITITKKVEANYEYSFADIVYKYRYIIAVSGIFIIIIIGILIYIILNNMKHIRKHKAEAVSSLIQKKRYQLVIESSDDMIYEIGIEANSGVSSEQIRDIFGWEPPKRLENNTFRELMKALRVHPDDIDQLYNQYNSKLNLDGIEKAVVQINSVYEGYIWCELSVMPLRDENDNIISYVGRITNIDDEIKKKNKQGQELNESRMRNENLEELLVNTFADNMANIMKLYLDKNECVYYVIEDGEIVEKTLETDWDEYFQMVISTMEREDANRLMGFGSKARLARLEQGEVHIYHYKSKYNFKKRKITRKYYHNTTKIRIGTINGDRVAIITHIDNSDVMKMENEHLQQKEEYTNKLFESQKFLFGAISGTYLATLKINLKNGSLKGFFGTEEGVIDEYPINVGWDEYCEKELIPYMDEGYRDEFRQKASLEALRVLEEGAIVKTGFKACLDKESLDPSDEQNFFVINFRIMMDNEDKIASVIFQCDSENVREEIDKIKKQELQFRKKRIMALLDNTTDIIYEIDFKNNECVVTGEKDNIYGWNLEAKIDKISVESLIEIWGVYPEDRFVVGEAIQTIISKKISISKDVRVQKSDGTYVWSKISAVPVMDVDGKVYTIICKIVNINDKVREKTNYMQTEGRDKLTGLLTKSALIELTETYLRGNSAKNDALILIDMDQLKTVNETLDHRIGDKVLIETAKKLQIIFSNYDYIGKFESDTFCVFVKNIPVNTLEDKLEWALEKLKGSYSYNGKIVQVSASIGVAYSMADNATYKELYDFADSTVYEAKQAGKGQYFIKRFF